MEFMNNREHSSGDAIAAAVEECSSEVLIKASGISKRFCRNYRLSLLYGARDIAGELLHRPFPTDRLRKSEFWALGGISFQLRRGEALGIVGKNGSGKTTLLRILSGLIKPTDGKVVKYGRLAPMLALGAGFNPVLTGRENIYTNMAILGLSKEEIDSRFDEVVAFSEIAESLGAPVQNYSSGMVARLGFACAVHTSPDVLLIDEVMAVGDIAFQAKCRRRIMEMREAGTTFLIINHAPQLIVDTCQKAIYLKDGRCESEGDSMDVIRKYEEDLRLESVPRPVRKSKADEHSTGTTHEADIVACKWTAADGGDPRAGQNASLVIETNVHKAQNAACFTLRIEPAVGLKHLQWKDDRTAIAQAASILVSRSSQGGLQIGELPAGRSSFGVDFTPLCLTGGHYRFLLWLSGSSESNPNTLLDLHTGYFDVVSNETMQGSNLYQPLRWFCAESCKACSLPA